MTGKCVEVEVFCLSGYMNVDYDDEFCCCYWCCRLFFLFFFFSSRRRHTRWNCDWSSDVCSSDLRDLRLGAGRPAPSRRSRSSWLLHAYERAIVVARVVELATPSGNDPAGKIGRASCRERV